MLTHLIQYKGKGRWVLALPLLIAIILFTIFSVCDLNDKWVRPMTFLFSSFILWFIDGGPTALRDGINIRYQKGKNTFMWIEVKYWALLLGVIGCVLLGILLK